jgi:hypothetical protein
LLVRRLELTVDREVAGDVDIAREVAGKGEPGLAVSPTMPEFPLEKP